MEKVSFDNTLVIVPTYNEAGNIGVLLEAIFANAPGVNVLFVDDRSLDGTVDEIKTAMSARAGSIHLIEREGKLGLGTAYIAGFKWRSRGNFA